MPIFSRASWDLDMGSWPLQADNRCNRPVIACNWGLSWATFWQRVAFFLLDSTAPAVTPGNVLERVGALVQDRGNKVRAQWRNDYEQGHGTQAKG